MRKKKKRIWLKITAFILIFGLFFTSLYVSSSRILQDYAVKDYSATITSATYRAFDSVLSEGYDFSSIIRVDKNSQGEIILLSTDSYGVNKIASDISKRTQKILNEETDKGVAIPVGAFTGIRLLAGFGKKIRMKLLSVSFVKTEIAIKDIVIHEGVFIKHIQLGTTGIFGNRQYPCHIGKLDIRLVF